MSDTYVLPYNYQEDDLEPGSQTRTAIADTAWNAAVQSAINEFSKHYDPSSTEPDVQALKPYTEISTYNDLYNKQIGDVKPEDYGLYNALHGDYLYLAGDVGQGISRATNQKADKYQEFDVMVAENFEQKFKRKGNKNGFFDSYVNEWATKIAAEVNALAAGVSMGNRDAMGPLTGAPSKEAQEQAKMYADAKARADKNAGIDEYKMPPLPGIASAEVANFKEQCFLLSNIFRFVDYKLGNVERAEVKRLPYMPTSDNSNPTNACVMAHGDPYAFINKLTQYGSQATLLNLQTSEIANLVPKIRLFKVFRQDDGTEISQEFHFDSFPNETTINFFLKDRKKRGMGVGIKDFTFSYEGNSPFAVKKSIKASLELMASSFDELFRHRSDYRSNSYRYVDLALKTGGSDLSNKMTPDKSSLEYENIEALNFRIKAVVGWQTPPGNTGASKSNLTNALNNSFVTLNLTPTIHKFDIQEDGSVKFTCQYIAYIEGHFDKNSFNVFGTESTFKNQLERKLVLASLNKNCSADEVSKVKKNYTAQVKKDIDESAASIIQRLIDKQQIRYLNVPYSSLADINKNGTNSRFAKDFMKKDLHVPKKVTEKITEITKTGRELKSSEKKPLLDVGYFSMRPNRDKKYPCAFFYVSDLMDVVLESVSERLEAASKLLDEIGDKKSANAKLIEPELLQAEKSAYNKQARAFRKVRVLLGPVELVNQQDPTDTKVVNMGDIPVSLKYFVEWLSKQTMDKASVDYSLPRFLNQFFKDFINTFLNDDTCQKGASKQRITLSQVAITAYKNRPGDMMDTVSDALMRVRMATKINVISRLDIESVWPRLASDLKQPYPVLNVSGISNEPISDTGAANEINYLIYYAARAHPMEKQNGDYTQDLTRGVHHYAIGKDRGIVKNIRMTATDVKYLKEIRFAREDYDGLEQLREVYNVSIDCYANVNTFPGTYIYVDPRGWSPQTVHIPDTMLEAVKNSNPTLYSALKEQDLTRFGIGGYYMIKRSEHSFGPGKANTTIEAQWVAHSAADKKPTTGGAVGKPDSSKCQVSTPSAASSNNAVVGEALVGSQQPVNARASKVQEYTGDVLDSDKGDGSFLERLGDFAGDVVRLAFTDHSR